MLPCLLALAACRGPTPADTEPPIVADTDVAPDTDDTDAGPRDTDDSDSHLDTDDTDAPADTDDTHDTDAVPTLLGSYTPAASTGTVVEISSNLSGVTWNPLTSTYLALRDSSRRIHVLDANITHVREITLENFAWSDLEDIVWLGGEEYALVSENGVAYLGTIPANALTVDGSTFQTITYTAPPSPNAGGEGIAWDPATQTFWVCNERSPLRIQSFARPAAGVDVTYDVDLVVTEPFDAAIALAGVATDMSSCLFDARTGRLLVLSQESDVVMDVDPSDGRILGTLVIDGFTKPEGIALDDAGNLLVVGEPNQYRTWSYTGP